MSGRKTWAVVVGDFLFSLWLAVAVLAIVAWFIVLPTVGLLFVSGALS